MRDCLGGARALTASAVTTYLYTPFLDVPYSPPLTFMNPFLWANNPHFLPLLHQYLVWLRLIRIEQALEGKAVLQLNPSFSWTVPFYCFSLTLDVPFSVSHPFDVCRAKLTPIHTNTSSHKTIYSCTLYLL